MRHKKLVIAAAVIAVLVIVALLLHDAGAGNALGLVASHAGSSYLGIAGLVFADAVCPVFPGETTLNVGSTLAAQGALSLGLVILAGAVGAVVGDSALYWVARFFSGRLEGPLERARHNERAGAALALLGDSAPVLLIAGRFVPGVRFVVNCTFGISKLPYRRFVVWSALGGVIWSAYTCVLAYEVGTALADFPLASVVISGAITTILMGVILWTVRRRRAALAATPNDEAV